MCTPDPESVELRIVESFPGCPSKMDIPDCIFFFCSLLVGSTLPAVLEEWKVEGEKGSECNACLSTTAELESEGNSREYRRDESLTTFVDCTVKYL